MKLKLKKVFSLMLVLSMFCSAAWADLPESEDPATVSEPGEALLEIPAAEEAEVSDEAEVPAEDASLPDQPVVPQEVPAELPQDTSAPEAPSESVPEAETQEVPAELPQAASEPETLSESVPEAEMPEAPAELPQDTSAPEAPSESVPEAETQEAPAELPQAASEPETPSESVPEAEMPEAPAELPQAVSEPAAPTESVSAAETPSAPAADENSGADQDVPSVLPVEDSAAPAAAAPVEAPLTEFPAPSVSDIVEPADSGASVPAAEPAAETVPEAAGSENAAAAAAEPADKAAADSETDGSAVSTMPADAGVPGTDDSSAPETAVGNDEGNASDLNVPDEDAAAAEPAEEPADAVPADETEIPDEAVSALPAQEEPAGASSADVSAEPVIAGREVLSAETVVSLPADAGLSDAPADVLTAASQDYTEASEVLPAASSAPTEGTEGFVYRLYQIVHGREPDAEGFRYWVDNLNSGRFTAADVIVRFFDSTEYMQSGRSNDEIVKNCYQVMLGREPDPDGFAYWKDKLDVGMTQDTLLAGFVRSSEFAQIAGKYGITPGTIELTNPLDKNFFRTFFVYRLYQNCLGRDPDKAGQTYWCQQLENGLSGVDIVQKFIFGIECDGFRYDNYAFTEMLYRTIHGRQYDEDGFKYWTNLLNYTASRERVVNRFALGSEFRTQCEKASIEVGSAAYEPDQDELWRYNIEILRLCNNSRRAAGLPDLYTREDLLKDLAVLRAKEITEYFSHTRPDGTNCFSLFTKQGFYGYLGENLAGGYATPQEAFNAWMNSAGHKANILNKNYTYLSTAYLYDPDATTYCGEGTYTGQYVKFKQYWSQSFCNYSYRVN